MKPGGVQASSYLIVPVDGLQPAIGLVSCLEYPAFYQYIANVTYRGGPQKSIDDKSDNRPRDSREWSVGCCLESVIQVTQADILARELEHLSLSS
jgi:hypothetical protein